MPPVRTIPAAKPLKTERTHEENQERAYIAASRRSDRSLEARVESARRASEIHKRRTGRSLRVTEQDVVNEEMYEEEDDDFPMQYRRLTAHLQTTNADFDRRLAAYLTNHVAMRTAFGATMSDNYPQAPYINAPQFANNQMAQFPQQNAVNNMLPPQMTNRSPQNFRQSPYTMPNQQQHVRPNVHSRAASIATPQELTGQSTGSHSPVDIKHESRRMSMPAHGATAPKLQPQTKPETISRTSSSGSLANLKHEAAQQHQPSSFPNPFAVMGGDMCNGANMPPFTLTLPMESQQLLGPSFDPNDPFTAMLLGKQDYKPQQSFYSYNPNGASKGKAFSPMAGMNQTLAPGVLDANFTESYGTPTSATESNSTPHFGLEGYPFDNSYNDMFKTSASGLTTPGEHDWANLIDANIWEESS
ncbi:hypothetical protein AAFC00_004119 [Neodothiora populina]|uniref:Uncharacterized protein n=1 Tax=Neodothiora populina TaxID=2781224 RepID=A0ABR3PIM2_9PEZI